MFLSSVEFYVFPLNLSPKFLSHLLRKTQVMISFQQSFLASFSSEQIHAVIFNELFNHRYIFLADKVEIQDITKQTCLFVLVGPKSYQVRSEEVLKNC